MYKAVNPPGSFAQKVLFGGSATPSFRLYLQIFKLQMKVVGVRPGQLKR
jgi:hypothetical protein